MLTRLVLGLLAATLPAAALAQRTQKPPLHGQEWMAVTGKPLGAAAGARIFLQGGNALYIEQMQARYAADPGSVDEGWRAFFAALADETGEVRDGAAGAPWARADWPPQINGEVIAALAGQWPEAAAAKIGDRIKA